MISPFYERGSLFYLETDSYEVSLPTDRISSKWSKQKTRKWKIYIYETTGVLNAPPADDVAGYILYFMFNFHFLSNGNNILKTFWIYVFHEKRKFVEWKYFACSFFLKRRSFELRGICARRTEMDLELLLKCASSSLLKAHSQNKPYLKAR